MPDNQPQRVALGEQAHQADWLRMTRTGQDALAIAHRAGLRPRCLCVAGGVEMYIAKRGSSFYLARMPGSGLLHSPDCPSVEDINLLSGADAYPNGVIAEQSDGTLQVNIEADAGMSIDGLLDLLIELADLNVRRPAGAARTWRRVREELLRAARMVIAGGMRLDELLVMAEAFDRGRYQATRIKQETFLSVTDAPRLVCAPLREIRPSNYGWQVVLKHLPDTRFWLTRPASAALLARWGGTLSFDALPPHCMVLLRTRPGRKPGTFIVSDMALRRTDRRFMPCLSNLDEQVSDELATEDRGVMRPLRFDIPWGRALADYVLLDCAGEPVPVFVLDRSGCDELDAARRAAVAAFSHSPSARVAVREGDSWVRPLIPPHRPMNTPLSSLQETNHAA